MKFIHVITCVLAWIAALLGAPLVPCAAVALLVMAIWLVQVVRG